MGCGPSGCKPVVSPQEKVDSSKSPRSPPDGAALSKGRSESSRGSSGLGRSLEVIRAATGTTLSGGNDIISRHDCDESDADSLFDDMKDSHHPQQTRKSKWMVSTNHGLPDLNTHGATLDLPSAEDVYNVLNSCLDDNSSSTQRNGQSARSMRRILSRQWSKYTVSDEEDDDDCDAELERMLAGMQQQQPRKLEHVEGGTDQCKRCCGRGHSKDSVYHSADCDDDDDDVDNLSYSSMSSIFSSPSVASLSDTDSLIEEDRSPSVNTLQTLPAEARHTSAASDVDRDKVGLFRLQRPNAAGRRRNNDLYSVSWNSPRSVDAGSIPPFTQNYSMGLPAAVS